MALPELTLNLSPIEFRDADVRVGWLSYDGDGRLSRLRDQYNATHVFRREGPNRIVAVPVVANAPEVGDSFGHIRLQKHLPLCAALIRNAILNYLCGLGRTVLSYEPLKLIARNDLLRDAVGQAAPSWLSVRPVYELAVRPVYFFRQEPFVAVALDVRTTRLIERTCAELAEDGFSSVGHYVGRRVPEADSRIAARFELLGKVQAQNGQKLVLTDGREGVESVESDTWLERAAFDDCLSFALGERAAQVREVLADQRASFRYGPTKLDKITKIVEFFSVSRHEMVPGVSFAFRPLLASGTANLPQPEPAPKPVYIFDPSGAKTNTWNDGGLNQHGPYTSQVFTPNTPRVCVICQKARKGHVEQFLHKLLNGVSLPSGRRNYFEKGFLRKYAIKDVLPEFFVAEGSSVQAYKAACDQAVERSSSGQKWDLALVQIEEAFHSLPAQGNPYFIAKQAFLTHQIPVQQFEIETAQKYDSQLAFVLNNMALATYAKLNGIPWLLKTTRTMSHELVIGLGSANVGEGRFGDRERFVGITTVFNNDGNYYLSNVSKAVPAARYREAMLNSLRDVITKVRTEMNWLPREPVRLVFYASFKSFNGEEIESVKTLMQELGDYDVEYAFLQVIEDHPYVLFDLSQQGETDFETRGKKGVYAPARAGYLQLSSSEVMLSLTGPKEVKRAQDGIPHPVLLKLHRESSFSDIAYLTKQVFAFSCHSWRTFQPASMPVTIQYSDLIARALGNLASLPRWDPGIMLGRIGRTRWFL